MTLGEIELHVIKSRCLFPCYYLVQKKCQLNVYLRNLYFIVDHFYIKLFNVNVMESIKICQDHVDFDLPGID